MWSPVFHEPPGVPVLGPNEVHLWRCVLDGPAESASRLVQTLSDRERDRARRYRFEEHRHRFIMRRGILRRLLGRYLDADPAGLELFAGMNGKPGVTPPPGRPEIHFTLSHSAGLALFAFGRFGALGVDLERIRPANGLELIVERFFPPEEKEVFRALPDEGKEKGFYGCWTRVEAYVKATGAGIGLLARGEAATAGREGWSLHSFMAAPGYAGALAVPCRGVSLAWFAWPSEEGGRGASSECRGAEEHGYECDGKQCVQQAASGR